MAEHYRMVNAVKGAHAVSAVVPYEHFTSLGVLFFNPHIPVIDAWIHDNCMESLCNDFEINDLAECGDNIHNVLTASNTILDRMLRSVEVNDIPVECVFHSNLIMTVYTDGALHD